MNSTDLIYTEDQQKKILEEIKDPQNKEGIPSASLVYSVINLLGIQANMIQELQKNYSEVRTTKQMCCFGGKRRMNYYKTEIINLVQNCDNSHWLKVIYAYVKALLG